jgi:lysyl-tRNA synthetase class II
MPNEELEPLGVLVAVAGRMMLKRVMGKASFATLQDGSFGKTHGRIQLFVSRDALGEEAYEPSSISTWATSSAPKARCSAPAPASCRSR